MPIKVQLWHCGVVSVHVAGRLWASGGIDATNAGDNWKGSGVAVVVDNQLTYTDDGGRVLYFAPDRRLPQEPCA